jgi:hypothetical protein
LSKDLEFATKSSGYQSYERLNYEWEINIKTDLKDMRSEDGRWIELAQDHVQ